MFVLCHEDTAHRMAIIAIYGITYLTDDLLIMFSEYIIYDNHNAFQTVCHAHRLGSFVFSALVFVQKSFDGFLFPFRFYRLPLSV